MAIGPLHGNVPYHDHRGLDAHEALVWVEVSREFPCPRCGAVSGCSVDEGRHFAHCRLVLSERPVEGGGWLHVIPPGALESALGKSVSSPRRITS